MAPLNQPVEWASASLADINFYTSNTVQPKSFPDETFELWSVPVFFGGEPEYLRGDEIGSSKQSVRPDDVLLCKINPRINRVWSVGEIKENRQIASSEWIVVRQPLMNSRYMLRYFQSEQFRVRLCSDVTGVGGSLTRAQPKRVANFPVVVPPLAEQKAIAEKLDTLLAQVESTKARLERIPKILKRFRQSVLAAAVSGKLTEEWRDRKGKELSAWEETNFSEICKQITVGYVGKMSDKYRDKGVPFLRSLNVRPFRFSTDKLLFIDSAFHKEIYKSRLDPGDLAIVRSGAPGTTCVIPKSLGQANCSDLVIARPSERLVSEFGCIFMNSEVAKKNVAENQVGVAQQHFNVSSMKKMPIHLPSREEQTEIVRRVDQLFVYADTIETQVNNALERVNNLTQSILAKAFRGELTEQWRQDNPDLISGEKSAEALLEKIKAEREVAKSKKKAKEKVRKG